MKLITIAKELENEFRRLTRQYNEYYWATSWAGVNSKPFEELISKKNRIKKIIVGIHFYQTHPDFIEAFLDDNKVRFILQPEGTFHPKIYLFLNNPMKWELIIGSANFTNHAFTKNLEASILFSSEDSNSADIFKNAKQFINKTWADTKIFNRKELDNYRITWRNHKQKIKSLSGQYGSKKRKPRPIHEVPVINKSWENFMNEIRNEKLHGLRRRLRVIELAKQLIKRTDHYNQLTEDERKFVAGIPNRLKLKGAQDWGYFGSMKGRGNFAHEIITNNQNISKALDQIPLSGQITKSHFKKFLKYYRKTFTGIYLGTATRLLSMKRPDIFVCLDKKNKSALCRDFGIIQSKMGYERYWDDIVVRIYDSDWWLNPNPKDKIELKVSEARAAFLDSLYYKE